jgi:hypothetical protein
MSTSRNTHYSNSSALFRILAIACIPALLFVLVNVILRYFNIFPVAWLSEVHSIVHNGLPFFLFLTGTFILDKKLRTPLLIFFPLFFISYAIKTLDYWEFFDFYEGIRQFSKWLGLPVLIQIFKMKWIITVPLLGLLITYTIHFFSKKSKGLLDFIKIIWLFCISYVLLSVYFPIHFYPVEVYEATTWIMTLLMVLGLRNYFRKPSGLAEEKTEM